MSADALTKRIVKITNKAKMQSLVQVRRVLSATWYCGSPLILMTLVLVLQVLQDEGLNELADTARQALALL